VPIEIIIHYTYTTESLIEISVMKIANICSC